MPFTGRSVSLHSRSHHRLGSSWNGVRNDRSGNGWKGMGAGGFIGSWRSPLHHYQWTQWTGDRPQWSESRNEGRSLTWGSLGSGSCPHRSPSRPHALGVMMGESEPSHVAQGRWMGGETSGTGWVMTGGSWGGLVIMVDLGLSLNVLSYLPA